MNTPPQNIYDNPDFFAGYADLRRNESGLNAVLEEPALRRLLPPLVGQRVLDLGCGMGNLCRYAAEQGAARVVGVDISEKMLAQAQEKNAGYENVIAYARSPLEEVDAPGSSFDVVTSSLALHYVADIAPLFHGVARWLAPGGTFVFSVEHPIVTARRAGDQGWVKDENGTKLYWPVDDYADEAERVTTWIISGVVKYHRTVATYINTLIAAGLRIAAVAEPGAEPEFEREQPDLVEQRRRPPFLFVRADKESAGR